MALTLKAALARLPSRFKGEMVFTPPTGELIDPDNFSCRDWACVLRRSKLQRIRFHDLRHTYASLVIAQGAHPKYIQVQLGHASIQTTLDRYGHLMPEMHEAEARKLDGLVFGIPGQDGVTRADADALQRSQNGHTHEKEASGTDRYPLSLRWLRGPATTCRRTGRWASASRSQSKSVFQSRPRVHHISQQLCAHRHLDYSAPVHARLTFSAHCAT